MGTELCRPDQSLSTRDRPDHHPFPNLASSTTRLERDVLSTQRQPSFFRREHVSHPGERRIRQPVQQHRRASLPSEPIIPPHTPRLIHDFRHRWIRIHNRIDNRGYSSSGYHASAPRSRESCRRGRSIHRSTPQPLFDERFDRVQHTTAIAEGRPRVRYGTGDSARA